MSVCANEDVFRLEIAVDDTGGMEAFDTFDNFCCVEACTITTETAPASELGSKISSGMEILSQMTQTKSQASIEREGQLTMTKNRFSLSWKLHHNLTTNGSEPSAAILFKTACSVNVCCNS